MMGRLACGLGALAVLVAAIGGPSRLATADVHQAMGFRVGEVTQTSAIVWTRVTAQPERNWAGVPSAGAAGPQEARYEASPIPVAQRDGAVPGANGQVRLSWSPSENLSQAHGTDWVAVDGRTDWVHQFPVTGLRPATRYFLRVEVRDGQAGRVVPSPIGSFRTAAEPSEWQDVAFAVITGQAYKDLDHREGFHIYPAMGKLGLDFLVPTGDTVYYDSEAPRARTVELARYHWHRMYSLPRLVEFHRRVPGYWEKDDHDTYADDCWPTLHRAWMDPLTFAEGLGIFREQVPMGEPTYRTVRWGRGLQVWLVEGRDYRSANSDPDGPAKSIWGKEQLAWLQRTVAESDADFRVLISPTPIVGPDRSNKRDNHSNPNFAHEGNLVRQWGSGLRNFYVCCGDRHWQYLSVDPESGLREFSCGPASDEHAGGTPGQDPRYQPFHRVKGGFLSVRVTRVDGTPTIAFRYHDVHGKVVHEYTEVRK